MNEMTAVIIKDIGKYEVVKKPIPTIKNGNDMIVKVLVASICGTDVHILKDPPGIPSKNGTTLGHEFVGEVIEIGKDVTAFKPGDRVIWDNNVPCGVCPMCLTGNGNLCTNMRMLGVEEDGIFAQYVCAPEKACVKLSKDVPLDTAIFAEPINCVMGAVNKIRLLPGQSVLVLGAGPIGLYFTKLLKLNGAGKVIVSEVTDFRANYAYKMGADKVINPKTQNLKEEVLKETDGLGADVVVDAVGVLLNDAIDCVKPMGKVLAFGMNDSVRQEVSEYSIVRKAITIIGNFVGNHTLWNTAKLLESGLVDFSELITHKLPLKDFGIGLEAMKKGEAIEVALYPFDE